MSPRKNALCIGISYKGQHGPYESSYLPKDWELRGAHGDVKKVCELLTAYYGYKRENINILQDSDGHTLPTRANILAAMEELVQSATPGGSLFFFFAGHADQITNLDGTEDDGQDEIILPLDWKIDESLPDYDRERYTVRIVDDEMHDILVNKLPHNCRLTAVFDSCHSGTLLDLPYWRSWGPRSNSPPLESHMTTAPRARSPELNECLEANSDPAEALEDPDDVSRINGHDPLDLSYTLKLARGRDHPYWRKGTWVLGGMSDDDKNMAQSSGADVVSWSACSDGQNGYEYIQRNRSGGVMVRAFVELLSEKQYRTYGDILQGLGDKLRAACVKINRGRPESQWVMQEPQLGSQHKPDLDKIFEP